MKARWRLLVAFLIGAWTCPAGAQQPLGSESRVNTYTTMSFMRAPAVSSDADGDFVVVWDSYNQDSSGQGVFGQRYRNNGTALGEEFLVNTHYTNNQNDPSISSDLDGDFVVVWQSQLQDGAVDGIFGKRYQSSGAPVGQEFRVNASTFGSQRKPSVASDADGDFVAVWQSDGRSGSDTLGLAVIGQRFASSGAALGGEFGVNTYTITDQGLPAASSDADGDFVVVWDSFYQDGSFGGIYAQRYASSGAPLGAEFRVNTNTVSTQSEPSVSSDTDGDFVVAWHSRLLDGSGYQIVAQRYASSGEAQGGEFRVSAATTSEQFFASVSSEADGDFVVVWHGASQALSDYEIFGQRYASGGGPLGPEFLVNTYTTTPQKNPAVSSDADGGFVVVWLSGGHEFEAGGVFCQRFGVAAPEPIVLEPGETEILEGPVSDGTPLELELEVLASAGLEITYSLDSSERGVGCQVTLDITRPDATTLGPFVLGAQPQTISEPAAPGAWTFTLTGSGGCSGQGARVEIRSLAPSVSAGLGLWAGLLLLAGTRLLAGRARVRG